LAIRGRAKDSTHSFNARPADYASTRDADPLQNLPPSVKTMPLAILVDAGTQSGAAAIAAALQDHRRARIFGRPTSGVASISTIFPQRGWAVKFTTARMFRPNGEALSAVGPDVLVEDDVHVDAFGSPEDRVLQEAVRVLGSLSRT
jgi:carboxyl-terminal processing protease